VTKDEVLLFPPESKSLFQEYSDQKSQVILKVYSLEEIVVEKLCSLLDTARSEPRDVYDTWFLLNSGNIDLDFLENWFSQKCKFKKMNPENLKAQLDKKEPLYKRLWEIRLRDQLPKLPYFETVYRELKQNLRKARLLR